MGEPLRFAPAVAPPDPLRVWAVSDGRAGIENQVLGLAEALARLCPAEIEVKRIAYESRLYDRLPTLLKGSPLRRLAAGSDDIGPPWPDVWIAAGRASLPFSLRMRRWSRRTLVVQVQDPRWPAHLFDLVVPPRHDRVAGDNVIEIVGAPHRVTPERLRLAEGDFASTLSGLPSPRIAVLVGGRSSAFDLSPERAARMAGEIMLAAEQVQGAVLVSFSRRTPAEARAIMVSRLATLPGQIYQGEGPNPYFAFLAVADFILVTEDSANMATEAASTGKPVFILKMEGQSLKFRRFHEELERRDIARPFGGQLYRWTYQPLDETRRAAEAVLKAWRRRKDAVES